MSETLLIAAPMATGVSLAVPKEYSHALSVLFSSLGVGCGIIGLYLAREGEMETAPWGMASVMFSLLSLVKSLELI